ncbi:MAG: hypothetical protein ABI612_10185 [Betaproteobacteria bacterium]
MANGSSASRTGIQRRVVRASFTALAVMLLASGCASTPKTTASNNVAPADIRVYESTELLHGQYSLVQHIWLDSWHSNLGVPAFKSESDGIDSMKHAASDLGANGVLHAVCVDARNKPSEGSKLYCYGDAIRMN